MSMTAVIPPVPHQVTAPSVLPTQRRLTKIVATISDLRCDEASMKDLYEAGVNVVRLNTAHQGEDDTLRVIEAVRKFMPGVPLLLDTKGPEVRSACIDKEHPVVLKEKTLVYVAANDAVMARLRGEGKVAFQTNFKGFVAEVPVGTRVLVDDGLVALRVTEKLTAADGDALVLEAENDGEIKNRKSVNTPGVALTLASVTERDKSYLAFAAKHHLDFVAHSFVRHRQDIADVRAILDAHGSKAAIIAKIENREGCDNIDEIIDACEGIMVARGDLGIEVPMEEVPLMQKMMIRKCIEKAKPVITATQMLHSMIENPRPTRAEVSDVANAVFDGTDAVMLSGETANGKYPGEAVRTMARIVVAAETARAARARVTPRPCECKRGNAIRGYLCGAAISAVAGLPVRALICDTESGRSAYIISTYRSCVPVYAQCHNEATWRQLNLSYGVFPRYMSLPNSTDVLMADTVKTLLESKDIAAEDLVVFLAGSPGNPNGSNIVEINTAAQILRGHSKAN